MKNIDKLFDWLSVNFLKANTDNCHLLVNAGKNVTLKNKNESISNSFNQKLLGILFNELISLNMCHFIMHKSLTETKMLLQEANYECIHFFAVWILSAGMDVS